MKIVQLNIWGGKLGKQIIDFLLAENPDFVCMQEVNDLKGRAGYKFFATLDEIKEEAGFSDAFMAPTYSSRYMERELEYGNAILSKVPIISKKTIFTQGKYRRHFDVTKDDGNIRNLQVATVEVVGKPLNIMNHHGYHLGLEKTGNDVTLEAMRTITGVIDSTGGPVILCGDFNLAPDTPSVAAINDKLVNLSTGYRLKSTYSRFGMVSEVCDYIFVNDQVKVRDFTMSDELISDHKALVLEFDL